MNPKTKALLITLLVAVLIIGTAGIIMIEAEGTRMLIFQILKYLITIVLAVYVILSLKGLYKVLWTYYKIREAEKEEDTVDKKDKVVYISEEGGRKKGKRWYKMRD